ncbi:MAG: T9SS type A sorting domain-containing protein [Acidobacteriota bacterium]
MKKLLLVVMAVLALAGQAFAQNYPLKTLIQIQQVPLDSLKLADQLGIGAGSRWLLQTAPLKDSTVSVVALVTVPPNYITYTAGGRTLCLVDTGANGYKPWSGVLVRYGGTAESFDANGYNSIQRGDIIRIRGKISEFPTNSMNSLTQFEPDTTYQISILSSNNPVPPPARMQISDFNVGPNPNGRTNMVNGEAYESKEVVFTGLTVVANVNTTRGTFMVADDQGNQLSMYDWSHYFTLGHGTITIPGDTSYHVPPIGARIDTLRGYISTSSGSEASRGYRISPIFPGDMVLGKIAPAVRSQRRFPVVVTPDSTPQVSARIYRQTGSISGAALNTIKLYYSVNNGAWQTIDMTAPQATKDSLYYATIPKQTAGAQVKYFIRVDDADNQKTILANSGSLTQYDSSQGFFFYNVINRTTKPVLSIADIQTTPFVNGRSSLFGATDSVGGIVTADTASLRLAPLTTIGTNAYYIQSGNAPWSGIWVSGPDSIMAKVANGDSIVVTGYINENFDVTRIENVTKMRVVAKGKPLPAPVKLSTDVFAAGTTAGEKYEGMLVSLDNVVVTDVAPVFTELKEFEVSNGSKAIIVRLDGKNRYSNVDADTAIGATILKPGTKIGTLTGIIYYSGQRYKIVPRTNADFQNVVTSVAIERDNTAPKAFSLAQNYPNPFNPSTNIRFTVAKQQTVTLKIYDMLGREVETLVSGQMNPGTYTVQWNARSLSSGVYFYRLQSGEFVQTMKLMLMK